MAFFSAFRDAWAGIVSGKRPHRHENQASLRQDFPKQDFSPDLHAPIDILKAIRRRILANTLLSGWMAWSSWILIGLIAVGALAAKLAVWTALAMSMAALGVIAILVWAWRTRPSTYETACRLDAAAGLQDRISTAIYLGGTRSPDGMIQRQRGDAVSRLSRVNPNGLFPVRMPATARRTLLLALAVAGLFTYRIHHKAPLVALLQTTARAPLVQSILSPLAQGMQKDLQRAIALVTFQPETSAEQSQDIESRTASDDLWQSSDNHGDEATADQQDASDVGGMPQDQRQGPGDQNGPSSTASKLDESNQPQSQNGKNGNAGKSENSSKPSDAQGAGNGKQSLSQSLIDALKNMMSKSSSQQSNHGGSQAPRPPSQGAPPSGNSHQSGTSESNQKGGSRGISDAKDKASQTAGNGAGSQQGNKQMGKGLETHPVKAVPERVALEASGYKDRIRMRVDPGTGAARLAVRDVSPQAEAVINGAEQENIPARYRLYVQRYFEHVDNGKQ